MRRGRGTAPSALNPAGGIVEARTLTQRAPAAAFRPFIAALRRHLAALAADLEAGHRRHHTDVDVARTLLADGLSIRAVARRLHAHPMAVRRALASS